MAIKIDKKIVDYAVKSSDTAVTEETLQERSVAEVIQMHERLERPEELIGSTYKIKTPLSEHALFVTINDITLNPGTEHELRRPFEIFINSKNMEHFQWIIALTRILSAVFRKGGDATFLVDELRSVFDPQGGYFKKGGRYVCTGRPAAGEVVTSRFNLLDAYRTFFDSERNDDPGVSGIALMLDTKKAQGGGSAAAFIREVRFFR